jgi:thiol-disulfide isomerase/thioredoxin
MWKRCLTGSLLVASAAGAAIDTAAADAVANPAFAFMQKDWPARGLTAGELEDVLADWDSDRAVLLYASWCRYCRQFKPIWAEINKFFQASGAKHMEV